MDSQRSEKIIVLAAFHLGSRLARHRDKSVALVMIDRALAHFGPLVARSDRMKLLFYALLRAEVLRDRPEVTLVRAHAKMMAAELDSPVFGYYMAVEASTTSIAHVIRVGREGFLETGGVTEEQFDVLGYAYSVSSAGYTAAFRALEIDEHSLSNTESLFVRTTSLAKVLDLHGVPSGG